MMKTRCCCFELWNLTFFFIDFYRDFEPFGFIRLFVNYLSLTIFLPRAFSPCVNLNPGLLGFLKTKLKAKRKINLLNYQFKIYLS